MSQTKTISANSLGINVHYENNKHHFMNYDAQLHGQSFKGKSYQDSDPAKVKMSDEFNNAQLHAYKKAYFGISEYSFQEQQLLTTTERLIIEQNRVSLRQKLAIWKTDLLERQVNRVLSTVFYKSTLIADLVNFPSDTAHKRAPDNISFKDLGLTRFNIAEAMVRLGFLPANFFELV